MAVTLKDVAERAGVSPSAVSRTFTDGASVSEKMRQRVLKAAKELSYSPNALASSLTTGRTKLIGLVSNNFHNPIFLEVFDLFTRALQEKGLRPLLANLTDEVEPTNSVRMMREYSVDGVIVASSTLPTGFAKAFRDAGIPVVRSFGRPTSTPQVHVVGIDNVEAGRMVARTLVNRGYKSVAYLGGPADATSSIDRMRGFLGEMENHPHVSVSTTNAGAYTFPAGRAEMMRLLDQKTRAEAYFCADDVLSYGALSAVSDHGLSCPEDIGIIGLNDMAMSSWESINLTTVRQPIAQIVSSSVELITGMLTDPSRYPEHRIFACEIVERGTLRPLPKAP